MVPTDGRCRTVFPGPAGSGPDAVQELFAPRIKVAAFSPADRQPSPRGHRRGTVRSTEGGHPLGRAVVTRQGARCEPQAPLSGAGKLCRALVRWRHQELLLLAPGTEFRLGAVCVLLDDGRSACFPECGGEPNASKRQLVSAGAAQNLGG
jgi:hypothetical protein